MVRFTSNDTKEDNSLTKALMYPGTVTVITILCVLSVTVFVTIVVTVFIVVLVAPSDGTNKFIGGQG
jgi:hypothetical protein